MENSKKFNLRELIWLGFNLICSISFTSVLANMLLSQSEANPGLGLGVHIIWIFVIDGIFATVCGWAYARMAQAHRAGNGGAYVYVRTGFGLYLGFIVSFMQYATMPMIITSQLVSMIRINFVDSGTFLDTRASLGTWSNLVWDTFSICIYLLVASTIFLGIKFLKKWLNWSSYIKWGSTILIIVATCILFGMNGTKGIKENASNSHITLTSFSTAFTSCFFFFAGAETLATLGENVENPRKNIGKTIIIVMIISIIFYIGVIVLFLGAILGHYSSNPNLQIFKELGDKTAPWINYAGVIIMLICTLSLKMNSATQITMYTGAIFEEYSKEGLMPDKYKILDKDHLPRNATKFTILLTSIVLIIWLILPDFLQGILHEEKTPFSYSSLTGEVSILLIIVYIFVIGVCLKHSFTKRLKTNWFEVTIWIIAFIFLTFQFEEFFRECITSIVSSLNHGRLSSDDIIVLVSSTMEIALLFVIFIFASIWYKIYYKPKRLKRLEEDPKIQELLDAEFVLLQD